MQQEPVEGFFRYQVRVGTIVEASLNEKARKPAYRLMINFGDLGVKRSSAQITEHYRPEALVGRQVVAVLNFPARQVASVMSEVLVLGATDEDGAVVLLGLDQKVADGTSIS